MIHGSAAVPSASSSSRPTAIRLASGHHRAVIQWLGHSPGVATSSELPSGSRKYRLVPPRAQRMRLSTAMPSPPQVFLPRGELAERDGEAEMQFAAAVVRRDEAARHRGRFIGAAVTEQQQHLAARHAECAHAAVVHETLETEHALVEVARAVQIDDVERGFQHGAHSGNGRSIGFSRSTASRIAGSGAMLRQAQGIEPCQPISIC